MPDLSARSVIASTLLGTSPPRLAGHLLVAFTGEFGIRPGTARTALSRMVDKDELRHLDGGQYELAGELLARHHYQEAGLHPGVQPWDGTWELYVVRPGARNSVERAALRRAADRYRLWERRDGVWMRPSNLAADRLPSAAAVIGEQADTFVASPAGNPRALLAELYDLTAWAERARELVADVDTRGEAVTAPDRLADGFLLAAATLRHLVTDPLLPAELDPPGWPATELRATYLRFVSDYQLGLRAFFASRVAAR